MESAEIRINGRPFSVLRIPCVGEWIDVGVDGPEVFKVVRVVHYPVLQAIYDADAAYPRADVILAPVDHEREMAIDEARYAPKPTPTTKGTKHERRARRSH
jgi:hypothetical protein